MPETVERVLTVLEKAWPNMSDLDKAWLLGFGEGLSSKLQMEANQPIA